MHLEDDLRRALNRQPPPDGFAERVIAEVERNSRIAPLGFTARTRRSGADFYSPAVRWLAAAAAVILVAGGTAQFYEHQRNVAEAKRVEAEIRLALQITSETLARVQAKLEARSR